jgi:alpha-ketoglutarate-dependent taurine dioxygenase
MSSLAVIKLSEHVGAEVQGVDAERLLSDRALPGAVLGAMEEHGVLVFPKLSLEPETQVAVAERLGEVDFSVGQKSVPGTMLVTLDKTKSAKAEYLRGTFHWHMDGCTLPEGSNPQAATILSAVALAEEGGETEFASTYKAFDALTPQERGRCEKLHALHSVAATQRLTFGAPDPAEGDPPDPGTRRHPLVWRHRSGRRSLVIGATAAAVVGMEPPAGRALLDDLLERATGSGSVYRHHWSVGDTVIWDNRGLLHRVEPYDLGSPREMVRTSLLGDEPIR